ncbi:lysophospholipid acyltransferase family protein [Neptunomonas japonica]|uniref:Lipid A biosynthesis lauroyl acyltransferase n=1 Tax=Neptunomonas japonica JAMM 1380 TaxID=1441457 RepID=A0A7R6SUS0_9GAMM|nr:lysophospholipid acyltransferase family protein [Neptunomonas japonica]BBB27975.1 lipid A biosynthesis lauroyl acyltransferase [Neptunomonas japonica JAMM 1380]
MKHLKAILAILVLGLMSLLPLKWAQSLGAFIGKRSSKNHDSNLYRITKINVDLCFPELSPEQKEKLIATSLIETGKTFSEMGMSWLWPPARSLKTIKQVNNESLVEESLSHGKGVILIAPHLGNWEILNLYLSGRYTFTAMYRPPKLKLMDDMIKKMRARLGTKLAAADASGVRIVMKALKRGEMVGILPDQEPAIGGEYASFFGNSAYTMKLLPQLAKQTGAKVICGYAERLGNGEGFNLHFIEADPSIYEKDLSVAIEGMNRSVERCVRALPEQYQWEYKRFDHQPDGVLRPYRKR